MQAQAVPKIGGKRPTMRRRMIADRLMNEFGNVGRWGLSFIDSLSEHDGGNFTSPTHFVTKRS